MALLQCPECQGKVSSAALACPHCGHPQLVAVASAAAVKQTSVAPAKKGSTQRIPLPVSRFPNLAGRPAFPSSARRPLHEGFQDLGNGSFMFAAEYAEVFSLVERALRECGFSINESSAPRGVVRAAAKHVLMSQVELTATFYRHGEGTRLEIKGLLAGMVDYFGICKSKITQVSQRIGELVRTYVAPPMQGRSVVEVSPPDYRIREDISYRKKAVMAFWMSFAGLFVGITGVAGLIMSGVVINQISTSNNKDGQGWAHAGLVTGIIAAVGWVLVLLR